MTPRSAPVSEEKDDLQVAPGIGGIGGKLLLTLFLSPFVLIGALFTISFFLQTCFALWSYAWRPIPCTILTSTVDTHPGSNGGATHYNFRVSYRYMYDGVPHVGRRYRPGYVGSSDIGDARSSSWRRSSSPRRSASRSSSSGRRPGPGRSSAGWAGDGSPGGGST
ncbi:MAG TPA: hypothetical protein VFE33_03145 [Thermoanaerobaculia bacterium]|nr:hypothetical protein [Thermoanaerobaculia bacterium]